MITADCPQFLRPRLRLYLSADIIGSTALKQAHTGSNAGFQGNVWFSAIQGFYIEANRAFQSSWLSVTVEAGEDISAGPPPQMWKTVGDEVLFVKHLTSYRQLALAITAWVRALEHMRRFVREQDPRLDVKCTAWTAGFPIKNKEVVLRGIRLDAGGEVDDYFIASGEALNRYYEPSSSPGEVEVDYIGPSIDTGFRLSGLSSSRRFTVSVDVAYILALTMPFSGFPAQTVRLFYQGSAHLKGVLGGVDYPHFWIDTGIGALPQTEDALTGAQPSNRDHVVAFCEAFYRAHEQYIFRPFIHEDTQQQLIERPPWYDEQHDSLVKNFRPEPEEPPETIQSPSAAASLAARENWSRLIESFSELTRSLAERAQAQEKKFLTEGSPSTTEPDASQTDAAEGLSSPELRPEPPPPRRRRRKTSDRNT